MLSILRYTVTRLNEVINSDIKQLDTWLQGNKLSLNVAKTHSMLVSTKQRHNILQSQNKELELKIRENRLEVVQKTKYFDVEIDSSLDWKEQIKAISTKVSRAVGFFFFFYPYKMLTIHVYLLYILILYNCTTLQGQ